MFDPDLLDLYSARLKDLGAAVKEERLLNEASLSPEQKRGRLHRRSPLCGSEVTFTVALAADGSVADIGWSVQACSLAAAASAIVVQNAIGCPLDELRAVRDAVKAMLRHNADSLPAVIHPEGRWQDLEVLKPAQMVRARHGSALLPFDAIVLAVEQALAS